MRSAAALGSVFSGLLPPPRQELLNLCLYHYPFLQNPKVMRSVLGGLAVRQAEPKVAEARQMQSEYVEAVGVPARHGAYHPSLSQCEVVLQA